MSEATLQRVIHAQAALIAALDGRDLDALNDANADLAAALADLQAEGGWHERPDLRETLIHAIGSADAARARINFLTDSDRRRLEQVVSLTRGQTSQAYGRNGRLR